MKIIEQKVYLFKELPLSKQQKLIEISKEDELDTLTNEDIIWDLSDAGEKIADAGFLNPDIYFNIQNQPEDGVCFECDLFNFDLLLEDINIPHKKWILNLIEKDYLSPRINKKEGTAGYRHNEYARIFILYPNINIAKYPKIYAASKTIEYIIEQKRYKKCLEAREEIKKTLNYITSEVRVIEQLEALGEYYDIDTLNSVNVAFAKNVPNDIEIIPNSILDNFTFENCTLPEVTEKSTIYDRSQTFSRQINYYLEGVLTKFLNENYHRYILLTNIDANSEEAKAHYINKQVLDNSFMTGPTLNIGTNNGILLSCKDNKDIYLKSITYFIPLYH